MRPAKLLAIALPLLTSCSSSQVTNYATNYATKTVLNQMGTTGDIISLGMDAQKDVIAFEALVRMLAQEVEFTWGDDKTAGTKEYVKYTNDYRTRVFIDFESGKVHIETLDQNNLRDAIISTLLTPEDPGKVDIFSDQEITLGEEPMLYGQVLDQDNKPIRWNWRAERFAHYLLTHRATTKDTEKGLVYAVDFDLVSDHLAKREYQYAQLVRQYAQRYNINESLIYAIMRTESSFNPYAVSHANAYGLMQVIPRTAGRDVFDKVKNRPGQPSKSYLFKPHNNIDTGTAYLSLLDTRYLKGIHDPLARKYAVISAYNGGAGNVFKTFDNNRSRAVEKMNNLKPNQVYWALTKRHPLSESRRYLEKVTKAEKDFYKGDV
ncbi:lytic murein transglycosylase [Endozoicomonas sp. (ex Bugula neritina AB1)]|nr:lytic murein transglycosylase [Endozoicomonas sp. (ex Bugula neritina AB1)]